LTGPGPWGRLIAMENLEKEDTINEAEIYQVKPQF
jgi:hypothetical protein